MNKLFFVMAMAMLGVSAFGQVKKPIAKSSTLTAAKPAAANPFKNSNDSISYAVGLRIAQSLKSQGFENLNMQLFEKAMADLKQHKTPLLNETAITQCFTSFQQKQEAVKQKENDAKATLAKKEGEAFLAQNGKRTGVVTLPSGLQYEVLKTGTDSTKPALSNKVKCHYTGTLINGTKFDSSVDRGEPITFPLNGVIRGWQEGLQLMTVGSKWKLYIPADLAYGDNAPPSIGPGATLIFEVELLGIEN